jgi:mycoredoxin-dependent peroxiredoxin
MPIDEGTEAPDFTLRDQNNQEVTLSDFRGRKSVLLVFYPLAFSGTCQGEMAEIQANLPDYANDNIQILTVSVDSIYAHKVWADREGFHFPLLADFWPHGEVARRYEVFDHTRGVADRGTFLIDPEGTIRYTQHQTPGEPRDQRAWRDLLKDLIL